MALDWSKCAAVESVPGKVSGAWVFRGTRLPVTTIFENLEDGMSIEEIMEQFDVTREQVTGSAGLCSAKPGSSDTLGNGELCVTRGKPWGMRNDLER